MASIRILSEWAQTGASMHALMLAEQLQSRHEVQLYLTGGDISKHPLPDQVEVAYFEKDKTSYRPEWPFWVSICVRYRMLLHRLGCRKCLSSGDIFQTRAASIEDGFYREHRPVPQGMFDRLRRESEKIDVIILFGNYNEMPYFLPSELRHKAVLIPLVHQEKSQYLMAARKIMRKYRYFAFNTDVERSIARDIHAYTAAWDESVALGMDDRILQWAEEGERAYEDLFREHPKYIFYAGRWTHQKMGFLIPYFEDFQHHHPDMPLELWMSGPPPEEEELPDFVRHFGYVGEDLKSALMKHALAVVNPSYVESLSLIVLEAMMLETPVLMNGRCDVLQMHAEHSGSFAYTDAQDFEAALEQIYEGEGIAERVRRAKEYVLANYTWEQVNAKWDRIIQSVSDSAWPADNVL